MHAIHMIDTQVAVNVAANVATITRTKTNKNVIFENLLNRTGKAFTYPSLTIQHFFLQ